MKIDPTCHFTFGKNRNQAAIKIGDNPERNLTLGAPESVGGGKEGHPHLEPRHPTETLTSSTFWEPLHIQNPTPPSAVKPILHNKRHTTSNAHRAARRPPLGKPSQVNCGPTATQPEWRSEAGAPAGCTLVLYTECTEATEVTPYLKAGGTRLEGHATTTAAVGANNNVPTARTLPGHPDAASCGPSVPTVDNSDIEHETGILTFGSQV